MTEILISKNGKVLGTATAKIVAMILQKEEFTKDAHYMRNLLNRAFDEVVAFERRSDFVSMRAPDQFECEITFGPTFNCWATTLRTKATRVIKGAIEQERGLTLAGPIGVFRFQAINHTTHDDVSRALASLQIIQDDPHRPMPLREQASEKILWLREQFDLVRIEREHADRELVGV